MVKQLVCLVIDEAHRASGNHSYCVAVRQACFYVQTCRHLILLSSCFPPPSSPFEWWYQSTSCMSAFCFCLFKFYFLLCWQLVAAGVPLRILALTATPGCESVHHIEVLVERWRHFLILESYRGLFIQQNSQISKLLSTIYASQSWFIVMKVILKSNDMLTHVQLNS